MIRNKVDGRTEKQCNHDYVIFMDKLGDIYKVGIGMWRWL
jgi:hypothetical protein